MASIEMILARSLAAHLAVPTFLSEPDGRIAYFNEAAEMLIGRSFEETPELSSEDLRGILDPRDDRGASIAADQMPLPRAMSQRLPAVLHAMSGRTGDHRYLATSVPFLDRDGLAIGALTFWYEEKL